MGEARLRQANGAEELRARPGARRSALLTWPFRRSGRASGCTPHRGLLRPSPVCFAQRGRRDPRPRRLDLLRARLVDGYCTGRREAALNAIPLALTPDGLILRAILQFKPGKTYGARRRRLLQNKPLLAPGCCCCCDHHQTCKFGVLLAAPGSWGSLTGGAPGWAGRWQAIAVGGFLPAP